MHPSPLRVHTDPDIQRPGLPLAPFIHGLFRGQDNTSSSIAWARRFDDWWRVTPQYIESVALPEADVAVLAFDWFWVRGASWSSRVDSTLYRRALEFADRVRAAGVPLVVFYSGDRSHETLPLGNAIVFREGLYRSRIREGDVAMPGFCEDLVSAFFAGSVPLRQWHPEPVVGFCGLATERQSPAHWGKRVLYHLRALTTQGWLDVSPYTGENLRVESLKRLAGTSGLRTNFVVREEGVFFRHADPDSLFAVRREYIQNLQQSDYVLCCRGSGNYSYRLFETLCMGRIPVFVDTDCVLPCEADVPWRNCCVWVDESKRTDLPARILEFHANLSPATYQELQRRNRQYWLRHLSPQAFFSRLPVRRRSEGT